MIKLLISLLIIGLLACIWMSCHTESDINHLIAKASLCKDINEIFALMGRPYEVYEQSPPKLGAHLIEPTDEPQSIVFYAFTVQRMPPVFLIVKTSKLNGKVLKVGSAKS